MEIRGDKCGGEMGRGREIWTGYDRIQLIAGKDCR